MVSIGNTIFHPFRSTRSQCQSYISTRECKLNGIISPNRKCNNLLFQFLISNGEQLNGSSCFITGVTVFDADRYNRGGLAQIVGGGLHQNNVTINFISKPGEYMLFTVIIYGYCVQNISQPAITHESNTLHANPINISQPIAPSYGWNVQSNLSTLNSTDVLVQNITTSSNHPWWHFWS